VLSEHPTQLPIERGTIVLAEDDLATRTVLSRMLTRENFRVVAVENGRLACEAVRQERPDVVVLDWLMPVMDGRAAVEELKASAATRSIPIVMLTSLSQVDERIIALESGVQDFLSKPCDPRELIACIEQQLRWRQGLAVDAHVAFMAERKALGEANERRHRLLTEAMPHIVWIANAHGTMTYFNTAWWTYTGGSPDSLVDATWTSAVHPDDRDAVEQAWPRALATGQAYEAQCRLRRDSDGMYRWHLVRAIPINDATGAVVEWVGSCADIHDYKIAGETRAILDTIGSIVAIRTAEGFVDYASPCWSQHTGATVDSALGFGWRDFVHPDDLALVDETRPAFGATDGDVRQNEMRLRSGDGNYRWFLTQTTKFPNAADAPPRWIATSTDIDDLKRTQSALASSEARYRALTDSMPQLVWVRGDAGCEYVNHRWLEYTGFDLAATRAQGQAALIHAEDSAAIAAVLAAAPESEYICEARFRRKDGVYRWHAVRSVAFGDGSGPARKWIGTATDIDDSKTAAALLAGTAAALDHLAHHDPLTDLPNRRLLEERLAQAITLAQRAKTEVLVLYLDLDDFKIINDTRGHAAGDRVLAVTGERIADALRTGDTAGRVGGDEFVLVCATAGAVEEAALLATRLLHAVGEPIDVGGEQLRVGASIGISMYPSDGTTGSELIRKADSAMYAAKQNGRNLFHIYRPETHSSIVAAIEFEAELATAVAQRQIVVYYQPIVSLRSNRLIGAEALVRWEHPRRGLLHPADFLEFAEAHRLGGEIAVIVLDAVCAQIAALGTRIRSEFHISMNVSARQIVQPGWAARVAQAVHSHGADPCRLQIELAESIVMAESASLKAVLDELRELGVSLSIDDFGTGFSSLARIKSFPLRTLKIDRSFVRDIVTNKADQAVAKAIITLAHSLGLNVVAAGVETTAQIEALRAYGSDAFQGYLASRPMDSAALADFVGRHEPHGIPVVYGTCSAPNPANVAKTR
jgi:diguanylate cyclase (GGDEF)-like protein/PAS domain S-box-containing protein